jgi:hypothetical protein
MAESGLAGQLAGLLPSVAPECGPESHLAPFKDFSRERAEQSTQQIGGRAHTVLVRQRNTCVREDE